MWWVVMENLNFTKGRRIILTVMQKLPQKWTWTACVSHVHCSALASKSRSWQSWQTMPPSSHFAAPQHSLIGDRMAQWHLIKLHPHCDYRLKKRHCGYKRLQADSSQRGWWESSSSNSKYIEEVENQNVLWLKPLTFPLYHVLYYVIES